MKNIYTSLKPASTEKPVSCPAQCVITIQGLPETVLLGAFGAAESADLPVHSAGERYRHGFLADPPCKMVSTCPLQVKRGQELHVCGQT